MWRQRANLKLAGRGELAQHPHTLTTITPLDPPPRRPEAIRQQSLRGGDGGGPRQRAALRRRCGGLPRGGEGKSGGLVLPVRRACRAPSHSQRGPATRAVHHAGAQHANRAVKTSQPGDGWQQLLSWQMPQPDKPPARHSARSYYRLHLAIQRPRALRCSCIPAGGLAELHVPQTPKHSAVLVRSRHQLSGTTQQQLIMLLNACTSPLLLEQASLGRVMA